MLGVHRLFIFFHSELNCWEELSDTKSQTIRVWWLNTKKTTATKLMG